MQVTTKPSKKSEIIAALDAFLEAVATVRKWRLLTPPFKPTRAGVRDAFQEQGDQLLEKANAMSREARRELVVGAGLWSLREAELSEEGWLTAWDQVAADTEDLLIDPIVAGAQVALVLGAEELQRRLKIATGFDLTNPRAVAYIAEHGAKLVAGINETTRDRLRWIIQDGAAQGQSYKEVAARIDAEFMSWAGPPASAIDVLLDMPAKRSRSETIAITELGQAYEEGSSIVAGDLVNGGLAIQKQWLTVRDDKVDPDICRANEAQGWIDFSDAFQSGHMQPLGHPLCRCTTLYRRVD